MTEKLEKPPTIRVGVSGIDSTKQKGESGFTEPEPIDWVRIFDLPPFQMYTSERWGKVLEDYVELKALLNETGDTKLFCEYCEWHKNKGYWPNEDPMGRLLSD